TQAKRLNREQSGQQPSYRPAREFANGASPNAGRNSVSARVLRGFTIQGSENGGWGLGFELYQPMPSSVRRSCSDSIKSEHDPAVSLSLCRDLLQRVEA